MKQRLVYNTATGTWMPAPEIRPQMRYSVDMPAPLARSPTFTPIPAQPAPPIRPNVPMAPVRHEVYTGPDHAAIPIRPYFRQPMLPQAPKALQEKAKWGQVTLQDTVPQPELIPKPNLPNLRNYNKNAINAYQAQSEQRMLHRGPEAAVPLGVRNGNPTKVTAADLGLNPVRGKNSANLGFGRYLSRVVGQEQQPY